MFIDTLIERAEKIKFYGSPKLRFEVGPPAYLWVDETYRFTFTPQSSNLFLETLHIPRSFFFRLVDTNPQLAESVVEACLPPDLKVISKWDKVLGVYVGEKIFIPALSIHDTISEHLDVAYILHTDIDEQFYTAVYMINDEIGVSVLYSDVFAGPPRFEGAVFSSDRIWRVPISAHKFRTVGDVLKIFDQVRMNLDESLDVAKDAKLSLSSRYVDLDLALKKIVAHTKLPASWHKSAAIGFPRQTSVTFLDHMRKHNPYDSVEQRYNFDSIVCRYLVNGTL